MTMHTVFLEEHERIVADPINRSRSEVPLWSGHGSQPPAAVAAAPAYGNTTVQSQLPTLELAAGGNHLVTVAGQQADLEKENTTQFTLFSGDCRTAGKTNYLQTIQAASMQYQGQFKPEFDKPLIYAHYPGAEKCYGVYSTYATQIPGRIMLPLSMASDGGPIFVNAKQYNGIMRRRKSRAKAELQSQAIKLRKPYMHLSRHLHALRRPRGNGGRFLNTKNSNTTSDKKSTDKQEKQHLQSTTDQSQISESDGGSYSTSPGSEVTSYLHHFFQPFLGNTGLGTAMAAANNNYLKV